MRKHVARDVDIFHFFAGVNQKVSARQEIKNKSIPHETVNTERYVIGGLYAICITTYGKDLVNILNAKR